MVASSDPPGHLDVPLAWGHEAQLRQAAVEAPPRSGRPDVATPRVGLVALWIAYLADAGMILLCVGCVWVLAVLSGTTLTPVQIVLAAVVGVEVSSFLVTAAVWALRGSPGMALVDLAFAKPVALSDALTLCIVWHAVVPLLGLPLLVRRHGVTAAERLAGARISRRPPHGVA